MGGGTRDRGFTPDELRTLEERARDAIGRGDAPRRNVFISYSFDDIDTINALRGQAANELTGLQFNDRSLRVAFDSTSAEYIRRGLRERIRNCSLTLVYLSDHSADSRWVDWEIRESLRQGKKVVGVYSGDGVPARLPSAVLEHQLRVVRWTHDNLMNELE